MDYHNTATEELQPSCLHMALKTPKKSSGIRRYFTEIFSAELKLNQMFCTVTIYADRL